MIDVGTKSTRRWSKRKGMWVSYLVVVRKCRVCQQRRDREYYQDKVKGSAAGRSGEDSRRSP